MGLRTKDLFFLLLALFCFFYCIFLSCDTMHRDTKAQKCFLRLHLDAFFSPPQGQQSCLCHQTCPVSSVVNKLHYSSGKWTSESWPAIWNATTKLSVITEEGERDTHTQTWMDKREIPSIVRLFLWAASKGKVIKSSEDVIGNENSVSEAAGLWCLQLIQHMCAFVHVCVCICMRVLLWLTRRRAVEDETSVVRL